MKPALEWGLGVALALAGHAVIGLLAWLGDMAFPKAYWIGDLGMMALFAAGLTQWAWVLPAVAVAALAGRTRVIWGLLVTAGLVFLLNTACFGVVLLTLGSEIRN